MTQPWNPRKPICAKCAHAGEQTRKIPATWLIDPIQQNPALLEIFSLVLRGYHTYRRTGELNEGMLRVAPSRRRAHGQRRCTGASPRSCAAGREDELHRFLLLSVCFDLRGTKLPVSFGDLLHQSSPRHVSSSIRAPGSGPASSSAFADLR